MLLSVRLRLTIGANLGGGAWALAPNNCEMPTILSVFATPCQHNILVSPNIFDKSTPVRVTTLNTQYYYSAPAVLCLRHCFSISFAIPVKIARRYCNVIVQNTAGFHNTLENTTA